MLLAHSSVSLLTQLRQVLTTGTFNQGLEGQEIGRLRGSIDTTPYFSGRSRITTPVQCSEILGDDRAKFTHMIEYGSMTDPKRC